MNFSATTENASLISEQVDIRQLRAGFFNTFSQRVPVRSASGWENRRHWPWLRSAPALQAVGPGVFG